MATQTAAHLLLSATISFAALLPLAPAATAGEKSHTGGHGVSHDAANSAIGKPANASAATRSIDVVMYDNYYEPESLSIKDGETVRFIVRNDGALVHEFAIGTAESHAAHQPQMQMMVQHGVLEPTRINKDAAKAMAASMGHGLHEESNSILLEPGETGEIVWTFPKHATLEFACNVPGHYAAGMLGDISLGH